MRPLVLVLVVLSLNMPLAGMLTLIPFPWPQTQGVLCGHTAWIGIWHCYAADRRCE